MTTSYVLEKQEELKAIKKLERQAEKLIRDKAEAEKKKKQEQKKQGGSGKASRKDK